MTSQQRDILISRVVDGTALEHDWAALETMGERDPALWRELAQSQRQHAALSSLVAEAAHTAEGIDLEIPEAHIVGRLAGVARWGGWAAAATIAVAWLGGLRNAHNGADTAGLNPIPGLSSSQPSLDTPADALKAYFERGARDGSVLGQMPAKVVLQAIPAPDGKGGYDVTYIRQIVEHARIDDLYRLSSDEFGRTQVETNTQPNRFRARTTSGSY